jgi:hypothetical protein
MSTCGEQLVWSGHFCPLAFDFNFDLDFDSDLVFRALLFASFAAVLRDLRG